VSAEEIQDRIARLKASVLKSDVVEKAQPANNAAKAERQTVRKKVLQEN
jgi:hypothetical protein